MNRPTAGEYRAIGLDLQGSSPEQAQQLQEQMEATKVVLESGNEAQLATLTKQQMVGDLLSATIYTYFALNNVQDDIAAQTAKITTYRAPSFGVFRTNLNPVYWFGIARDVQFNGLVMDVDLSSHQTVANDNSRERWLAFNKAIGARGSAMEHLVPEQMFSTEDNLAHGISAVKALSLASAQGQKIYTIDQSNLEEALAAISLSSESEAEIRAGVQAGKIATAHESQIEYHGWVGEGYIVIDPATGSGAYKIASGDDGGALNKVRQFLDKLLFNLKLLYVSVPRLSGLVKATGVFGVVLDVFFKAKTVIDLVDKCLNNINIFAAANTLLLFAFMAAEMAIAVTNPWVAIPILIAQQVVWDKIGGFFLNGLCASS